MTPINIDTEKTEILKNVKKRLTNLYNMLHKYPFSTNLAVSTLEAFIAHTDDMSEDEIINIFEMLDTVFVQFQNIALEQLPKSSNHERIPLKIGAWHKTKTTFCPQWTKLPSTKTSIGTKKHIRTTNTVTAS